MIILASADKLTFSAKKFLNDPSSDHFQYYDELNLSDIHDNTLILLDLSASGQFQKRLSASAFVDRLITCGLSVETRYIDLYISDVNPEKPLSQFAHQAASYLKEKYQREISLRIASDHRLDCTLLVPPNQIGDEWKVYGIQKSDLEKKGIALEFTKLHELTSKTLLWKGRDLQTWLNMPAHVCECAEKEVQKLTHMPSSKLQF